MDSKHRDIESLADLKIVDEKPAFVWIRHPHTMSDGGRYRMEGPAIELVKQFPALRRVLTKRR